MARKVQKVAIGAELARTIRRQRQHKKLTQKQLAELMQEKGFSTWVRETVTQVENEDHQRIPSLPELLALGLVLETSVIGLIWDFARSGASDDSPPFSVELVSKGATVSSVYDLADLFFGQLLSDLASSSADRQVRDEMGRWEKSVTDFALGVAKNLEGTAKYIREDLQDGLFHPEGKEKED